MGKASRLKKLKSTLASLQQANNASGFAMNIEGVTPRNNAVEEAMNADRAYFERHPLASVYVRQPFPGEFDHLPEGQRVIKVEVRQIAQGTRVRCPLFS